LAQLGEITELAQRRGLLVAESACLREQIAGDLVKLEPVVAWVDTGFLLFTSVRAFWPVIAAATGFVAARKKRSWVRSLGKLWAYWRVVKQVLGVWRRWRADRGSTKTKVSED